MPSWTSNLTARGTMAGPGGVALADVPERFIAWVIDVIILNVIGWVLLAILGAVLVETRTEVIFGVPVQFRGPSIIGQFIGLILTLVVSAAYFIYMWTRMNGATVGMRLLKLSVRDEATGGPISQSQAINRWLALGLPQIAFLTFLFLGVLGWLFWLGAIVYYIYLIVSTAQSPTRQGFHDKFAKSVVAKAA